jgi:hypothetical protein
MMINYGVLSKFFSNRHFVNHSYEKVHACEEAICNFKSFEQKRKRSMFLNIYPVSTLYILILSTVQQSIELK